MKNGWKKFKKLFSRKPKQTEVMCIETITSTDASQPTQDATNQIVKVASNANNDSVGTNAIALVIEELQRTIQARSAQELIDTQLFANWSDCLGQFILECDECCLYDTIEKATIMRFDPKIYVPKPKKVKNSDSQKSSVPNNAAIEQPTDVPSNIVPIEQLPDSAFPVTHNVNGCMVTVHKIDGEYLTFFRSKTAPAIRKSNSKHSVQRCIRKSRSLPNIAFAC